MSVSGAWINAYGSIMTLTQIEDGSVYGIYTSSTGSTGVYNVLGWGSTSAPPEAGEGQSLVLTIFWRSVGGGKPDNSWHWVSGLGGQSITMNGIPLLILTHAMVATDNLKGLADVGTYMDKLVYQPHLGQSAEVIPIRASGTPAVDPIEGTWTCEQFPDLSLQVTVQDCTAGFVSGKLMTPEGNFPLLGFADTYASAEGLALEGLTVAANLGGNESICYAGSLDIVGGVLSLLQMNNTGTPPSSTYVQTSAQGLYFRRP